MLGQRLLVGAVGAPAVLVLAVVGGVPLTVALAGVAVVALAELRGLLRRIELDFSLPLVGAGALAMIAAASAGASPLGIFAVVLALGAGEALARGRADRATFLRWPAATFALGYIGLPLAVLSGLAADAALMSGGGLDLRRGAVWVLAVLALTWGADSAAYAAGRLLGRRRLAPVLSPSKSLEGAIAAVLAPALVGAFGAPWIAAAVPEGALLGAVAGMAAIAGDLAESLLKRAAGVKDSGALLPGHGGLLDRIDSLLFVVPIVAVWARLVAWRG